METIDKDFLCWLEQYNGYNARQYIQYEEYLNKTLKLVRRGKFYREVIMNHKDK